MSTSLVGLEQSLSRAEELLTHPRGHQSALLNDLLAQAVAELAELSSSLAGETDKSVAGQGSCALREGLDRCRQAAARLSLLANGAVTLYAGLARVAMNSTGYSSTGTASTDTGPARLCAEF